MSTRETTPRCLPVSPHYFALNGAGQSSSRLASLTVRFHKLSTAYNAFSNMSADFVPPSIDLAAFRKLLLAWYDTNARRLPWREDHDPYRVWVSEIMLQQTRVAAVIAHYHDFLRRFPNVQKLAAARESSVLAAWSGLGYYRRARMMHAAAKVIARERKNQFPSNAAEWRDLPGIGRYTAAAIASISLNEPVAVVDGNVERVLQRLCGRPLSQEHLWQTAEHVLDRSRPGDFNQAMMELGATVCTPRAPACLTCPVIALCATRGEMPSLAKPMRQMKRDIHYLLHRRNQSRGSEVLLVQRPASSSLMPGMWELPEISPPNGSASPAFTLRHSITVTDYTVHVWKQSSPHRVAGKWIPLVLPAKVPLTGLARKILRRAAQA